MALLNVGPQVSPREVRLTITIAVALILLGLLCNLGTKVLAGYQELHRYNYAAGLGALASLGGLALGVLLHVRMPMLYLISVGCLTFSSMGLLVLVLWRKPWLLPRPDLIDTGCIRELLSSGSFFFLIQVAAVVVFSSDNVIVSHYLGASEVTPYSVTWRLAGLAAALQSLIFPALWPAYAEAFAKREYGWIRRTFATTMKGSVALNLCCAGMMTLFGRTVIRLWAGTSAVPTFPLMFAMSLWVVINGFMSVESCLLGALNRICAQALLSITAAAVNIALSIVLVHRIGALGVISGTIASYVFVLALPQTLIVRNALMKELADRPLASVDLRERTLYRAVRPQTSNLNS
jgi:O-antigen/teichoic acid export membrane protein